MSEMVRIPGYDGYAREMRMQVDAIMVELEEENG